MQNIHFRVLVIAFTGLCTIFSIIVRRTHPFPAIDTHPSLVTMTKSIGNITSGAIFTTTHLCTIQSIHIVWAGVEALVTSIAWRTKTLARDMMATAIVKALT